MEILLVLTPFCMMHFHKGGDDDNNQNPEIVSPDMNTTGLEGGDYKAEGDPGKPIVDDSQLG